MLLYKGSRKMAHRFWYNQPVNFVSSHNIGSRIINTDMPKSNSWTNYKNISFYSLYDEALSVKNIQTFLIKNYKQHNISDYIYTPMHLNEYLKGHNSPVFVGIYKDNTAAIKTGEMIGCITAYPLNIISKKTTIKSVYYVDNLCVKSDMRGKNIAPQMIATLYHHFRNNINTTKIALFKRENFSTNYIVPLVCYHSSLYHIETWFTRKYALHASAKVLDVSKQNINLLYSFIYSQTHLELLIFPELSNVESLIEAKQLFIKLLIVDEQISAVYVFRDANTLYNGVKTIECIGSINNQKNIAFFVNGFFYVLEELYSKHKFKILQMENQADNNIISKKISSKWSPYNIVPIAWFFYNYIFPQQLSENTFILA
tara:strand:- start:15564 stop:16676 length:1113 start_codon:yes stop_codon:yes gene_type:complete